MTRTWNEPQQKQVKFSARVTVSVPDNGVEIIDCWVHALQPPATKVYSEEQVANHLADLDRAFFVGLLPDGYDRSKCWQVLFTATLHGWWSGLPGEEEWDEKIISIQLEAYAEIPLGQIEKYWYETNRKLLHGDGDDDA